MGVSFRKVAQNFGQCDFSQHAKRNIGRFRAFFSGENQAKVRWWEFAQIPKKLNSLRGREKAGSAMKEAFSGQRSAVSQKEAISSQHSAISQSQNKQQNQKRFTTEDTENTEKSGDPVIARDLVIGKAKAEEQERVRQRSEALLKRIGEACDELERLAEENPELVGRVTVGAEEHKEAYLRLKARLALADSAPRCRWIHQDGTTCGSPQMKRHIYCFAHKQMAEAQALALRLPALEDANAIIIGIMRIQKALIDGTISTKTAGLLLYSMQLALQAVRKTTFGQVKGQELVRETVDEEEALSSQQSAFSQSRFTTEDTEDAEEGKERGAVSEPWPKPVEWKPTPDMYRKDTPEGREAYEASFRMKIEPRLGTERRPPRSEIKPSDRAEPLPKGTRFACEPLEAGTRSSALQAELRANQG
jgi:hypothetical protein